MNARFSQKFISPLKRAKTDITDITNYTCINHHKSILSLCKPFIDRRDVKKYIIKQILLSVVPGINGFIQKNFKFYLILVLVTWCHRYIINYWVLEIKFHRITDNSTPKTEILFKGLVSARNIWIPISKRTNRKKYIQRKYDSRWLHLDTLVGEDLSNFVLPYCFDL